MKVQVKNDAVAFRYDGSKESMKSIGEEALKRFKNLDELPFYSWWKADGIFFINCPATEEELEVCPGDYVIITPCWFSTHGENQMITRLDEKDFNTFFKRLKDV